MSDPLRKARADRYRLKLMEQYLRLRDASEDELERHECELNELLDSMGYFDSTDCELQADKSPEAPPPKQKTTLLC
jgi:hypothetical protein